VWFNDLLNRNKENFKIIAHLPLNNSPVLEGVDLLPDMKEGFEDDVKRLVLRFFKDTDDGFTSYNDTTKGFIAGYKAATKRYSEEDIFGFLMFYNSADTNKPEYRYKHPSMDGSHIQHNNEIDRRILAEYLQSLNPRPKYFVAEMETKKGKYIGRVKIGVTPSGEPTYINEGYEETQVLKTTTDNQGRTVWYGKYE